MEKPNDASLPESRCSDEKRENAETMLEQALALIAAGQELEGNKMKKIAEEQLQRCGVM